MEVVVDALLKAVRAVRKLADAVLHTVVASVARSAAVLVVLNAWDSVRLMAVGEDVLSRTVLTAL